MLLRPWATIAAVLLATGAAAQQPVETVEVIGTTPLGGAVDPDKIAANVQRAVAEDLRAQHALGLADFMNQSFGSLIINDAQSNPLQPDVQYRGFVGSPLLGLPQGLAVYQDGVRVNEPFGDTVNWALIPEAAIESVDLVPGSNPLFGLNALGGAIAIRTRDGYSAPGTSAEATVGSWARRRIELESGGVLRDELSYFITGNYLEEDGWRDYSPTEAAQLFGKLGWQAAGSSFDLSLTLADTDLIGNGPAPADLLALDRKAIFTRPDQTRNDLMLLNLVTTHEFSDALSLTGNVYLRTSDISSLNGDDSNVEPCATFPGFLCEIDDAGETVVLDAAGNPIPDLPAVDGAAVNRTRTEQDGRGLAIQAGWARALGRRDNELIVGVAVDESDTAFEASTELGSFDASRLAVPGGYFVGDAFTAVDADVSNTGFYVTDTLAFSSSINLTFSGRYNETEVVLRDRIGTALNGDHRFSRFNPAVGLTLNFVDVMLFYASFSESNRAPSPVELTCADPDDPCRLPNAFLADPPLEQVVAKTLEAGVRGRWIFGDWHIGVFRTVNHDDIVFISAGALSNEGYFDNVGRTRRDGFEWGLTGEAADRVSWFANFSYLDATFRESFAVPSPNNPAAVGGEIPVDVGDRLPLIPETSFKAGFSLAVNDRISFGGNVLANGDAYFRGDEGNLSSKVGSYAVLNMRAEYALSNSLRLFASVNNLLDSEFETFGLFGEADEVLGPGFADPRFLSPGAPRAAWIGLRATF